MASNIKYSLKVWLTGLLVTPALFLIITNYKTINDLPNETYGDSIIFRYIVYVIIGTLLSFISSFLFWIIVTLSTRYSANLTIAKAINCVGSVTLTVIMFRLAIYDDGFVDDEFIYLMLLNCFCVCIGSWVYKLPLLRAIEKKVEKIRSGAVFP
ncbi:hypothetical protein [Mucilaginibacter sp.]|uniref:hypothetical protein n=1 Tax=Mucilaginibacter sp. TaxID=1882438 RepID=UPI0025DB2606|nr:hypothetical protein [Mucilaginibacter sp.]